MGSGDNRRTRKACRRKAQRQKKEALRKKIEAGQAAKTGKPKKG